MKKVKHTRSFNHYTVFNDGLMIDPKHPHIDDLMVEFPKEMVGEMIVSLARQLDSGYATAWIRFHKGELTLGKKTNLEVSP